MVLRYIILPCELDAWAVGPDKFDCDVVAVACEKRVAMVKPTALVVVRGSRHTLLLWWLIRREKVRLTS